MTSTKPTVELGNKARDTITGYTGIVIAITTWLNGCVRITIQTQELHDGKPIDSQTFDVEQVEVIPAEPILPEHKPSGGPTAEPSRNRNPGRHA